MTNKQRKKEKFERELIRTQRERPGCDCVSSDFAHSLRSDTKYLHFYFINDVEVAVDLCSLLAVQQQLEQLFFLFIFCISHFFLDVLFDSLSTSISNL